jgi:PncC family amidohydrolase
MKEIEELVQFLKTNGVHIVTMESCTGGMLASEITNIPGASDVLKDSFITYSNEAKIACGVDKNVIKEYTVYSPQVARQMAHVAIQRSIANAGAIMGIGITGSLTRVDPNNVTNSVPGVVYIAAEWKFPLLRAIWLRDLIVTIPLDEFPDTRKNEKEYVIKEIAKWITTLL